MLFRQLNWRQLSTLISVTLTLNFCLASWSILVNAEEVNLSSSQNRVNFPQPKQRNTRKRPGTACARL